MTVRPLGTYPRIRRADRNTDLDRRTWAGPDTLILDYDVLVVQNSFETEILDFGLVFEGRPFFSYGVELASGELQENNYPLVTAGVSEWLTSQSDEEEGLYGGRVPFYLGASLWIGATLGYDLRFRLSFEGISMRNVEHFRGL